MHQPPATVKTALRQGEDMSSAPEPNDTTGTAIGTTTRTATDTYADAASASAAACATTQDVPRVPELETELSTAEHRSLYDAHIT